VVAFGEHAFVVRGEGGVVVLRTTPRIRSRRLRRQLRLRLRIERAARVRFRILVESAMMCGASDRTRCARSISNPRRVGDGVWGFGSNALRVRFRILVEARPMF
jgi:hypothetical protein